MKINWQGWGRKIYDDTTGERGPLILEWNRLSSESVYVLFRDRPVSYDTTGNLRHSNPVLYGRIPDFMWQSAEPGFIQQETLGDA